MPQRVPTREEVEVVISALLVTRKEALTSGVPIAALDQDYREQEGRRIPFRELGHSCLLDCLQSMSSCLSVRHRNGVSVVYPLASEKTAHVSSLVARQKTTIKRSARGGRRPIRQSTWFPRVSQPPRRLDSKILSDIVRMARNRPDGMHRDEVLQYIRDRLNYNFEPEDLKLQLREVNHEIVVDRDVIYPVSNYTEPARNSHNSGYSAYKWNAPKNGELEAPRKHCNIRAAGSSDSEDDDDFTMYRKCSDSRVGTMNDNATTGSAKLNDNNNNDSNRINTGEAEPVAKSDEHAEVQQEPVNHDDEECETGDPENIGMLISERTRFRLEKLVQNHPEGIWCAELPDVYLKEYKFPLNYEELGFSSVSDFAAYLPDVFHSVQLQDKGDFKLFDAKSVRPNLKQSGRPCQPSMAALYKIYEAYGEEDVLPVPAVLPNSTCQKLVPEGVVQLGETVPQICVTELDRGVKEYIDVVVVEIFTPSFFWIHLLKRTQKFEQFMSDLHVFYTANANKYVMPIILMERGMNCACKYDNTWHRGIIKTVKYDNTVTVMFYDYGTVESYPPDEIHFLHRKFSALPAQAIPCGLYNVKPRANDKWLKSVTVEFTWKVLAKPLVATIAITDADNNSMLIGLTNTEGTEDFHINDWMVKKGYALYGKMVCIRPPNYPFRRFLECEYEVNAPRCKSTPTVSKVVQLNENINPLPSSPLSNGSDKNLEWYKMLSKLRRSSKSGKTTPELENGAGSMNSETRRGDPKICHEVKSQSCKNRIPDCSTKSDGCSAGLVDVGRSKFGTNFLREMCEAHARREVSSNIVDGHGKSSGGLESNDSSSSASAIVPEDVVRDRRTGEAQLADGKTNSRCQQGKSSIGGAAKSSVSSSLSAKLSEGCVNQFGDQPLHLRPSPTLDGPREPCEFGTFRSLNGGHGRMDPIDWHDVCGIETTLRNIKEASAKASEKSVSKERSAKEAFLNIVRSSSKADDSPRLGTFNGRRDIESSPKPLEKSVSKQSSAKEAFLNVVRSSSKANDPSELGTFNGHRDVNTSTNPLEKSVPKERSAKEASWNVARTSSNADDPPELGTFIRRRDVDSSTKPLEKSIPKERSPKEASCNVARTSSNADDPTPKLPSSKIALWNMVERSKKNSIRSEKNHSRADITVSTGSSSSDLFRHQRVPVKEASTTQPAAKLPSSSKSLWDMVEVSEDTSPAIAEFHSPTGGHGRMDPVTWSDVRRKILNCESLDESTPRAAPTEVLKNPEKEVSLNLPRANRSFLNLVNDGLPRGRARDSVFLPEGNIRADQEVSPTVRRLMKRLEEDPSEKRVRLMIPDDVLELLRDDEDEDEGVSIAHDDSSSRAASTARTVVRSNGINHDFSDSLVRDSGSSNSPKESSKLNGATESLDSTRSTDKDVRDIQTSDNATNTTAEISKASEEPLTAGLDQPGSNIIENDTSNDAPGKLSTSTDSERTNAWIENHSLKPSSKMVQKLSKLITARLDSTIGSELDSDDLCSYGDDGKESPVSSKDRGSRVEDAAGERRDSGKTTARRSLDGSSEKIDEAIVAEVRVSKVESKVSNETGMSVEGEEFVRAGSSGPPAVFGAKAERLPKINVPFCPVFDDTDLQSDTEEWDFSPHRLIPEMSGEVQDFEDIDEESSDEVRPRLESLENNAKEASSLESSLEISENDEPDSDAGGSSRQETDSEGHRDTHDAATESKIDHIPATKNIALNNISKLRNPPRLVDDRSAAKVRATDSDERSNSNDNLSVKNPAFACRNENSQGATPKRYPILSEVKKKNISAMANAFTNFDYGTGSEKSSSESYTSSLISALKSICS